MNNENLDMVKALSFFIIFSIVSISFLAIMSNLFAPTEPNLKERCEANNGTYIENYGRVGNSCIYDKGEK